MNVCKHPKLAVAVASFLVSVPAVCMQLHGFHFQI